MSSDVAKQEPEQHGPGPGDRGQALGKKAKSGRVRVAKRLRAWAAAADEREHKVALACPTYDNTTT